MRFIPDQQLVKMTSFSFGKVGSIFTTLGASINCLFMKAREASRQIFRAPGRGASATMQLTSGGSDSEDSESEDSDEAETRKLRMFDGMSIEQVERIMHPDYVAKRESLNRKVEEMERHQNYVKWNASEIPVVSADAIQNHLRAFHGSPERRHQRKCAAMVSLMKVQKKANHGPNMVHASTSMRSSV